MSHQHGNPGDPNSPGGPGDPNSPGNPGGGSGSAVPVPEGLGTAEVGLELAGLLAGTDVATVSGYDTVEVMTAAYRQATHYQAVFYRAFLETGLRLPAPDGQFRRADRLHEFSADEARTALVWSRTRAESTLGRAAGMFETLPPVGQAMLAGVLDEPRARAFCDWTSDLSAEHAQRVCAELLPAAPGMMVGELVNRIKRLAIALDPDWAERRYTTAIRQRKVIGTQNPDGTGNITGANLPIDRAAAGCDRIDTLARACKQAGDTRRIDHIRADLFLGMIDGTFETMTDTQIITHILHTTTNNQDGDGGSGGDGDIGGGSGPDGDGDGPRGDGGGNDPSGDPNRDDDDPHTGTAEADDNDAADGSAADDTAASGPGSGTGWCPRELRVELATLLGLNQHPGELPGLGYIPANVARHAATRMTGGQWRFVICHPDTGRPMCSGITTARPCTTENRPRRDARRGGIVELHLTTTDLTKLATVAARGEHPAWADLIADVAHRYATGATVTNAAANGDAADLRRRRARAGLRRWIEVRDRYCQHPACRMPATRTDQDHRTDYATGGLTTATNLDSACRHDHRLQHDGGWTVTKTTDDTLVWTSPLEHSYTWRPPPILPPLPEPGAHCRPTPTVRARPTRECGCPTWTCICHTPTMPTPNSYNSRTARADNADTSGTATSDTANTTDDDIPPF